MGYDINTHGDFKRYFDKTQKRNIWVLGYFGGGAVRIVAAMALAIQYSEENNVPLETVQIDEILSSRRFKGFKFIYSCTEQKQAKKVKKSDVMDNVYAWLRD